MLDQILARLFGVALAAAVGSAALHALQTVADPLAPLRLLVR